MKRDDVQKALKLYLVTDRRWLNGKSLKDDIELALKGGVTCVQLREKNLEYEAFVEEAKDIKKLCQIYHVPLIINDRIDVLMAVDADGIHVGQQDMNAKDVRKIIGPHKILGVSARSIEEAKLAQENGADYLGVGAVFGSQTKNDAQTLDLKTLKMICQNVDRPVVAIGGIDEDNILQLKGSGITGVAVVSAIMAKDDIQQATHRLKEKVIQW